MSWNIIAAIQQEDHNMIVRPMILPRAAAGFTRSATVIKGDTVDFSGIQGQVIGVYHKHAKPGDLKAPITEVHVAFETLFDNEIEVLKSHGFTDLA